MTTHSAVLLFLLSEAPPLHTCPGPFSPFSLLSFLMALTVVLPHLHIHFVLPNVTELIEGENEQMHLTVNHIHPAPHVLFRVHTHLHET